MSVDHNSSDIEHNNLQSVEPGNDATIDNNNNDNNERLRSSDIVSPLTSPTSSDDPLTILTRGPEYLRARIFQRQSGGFARYLAFAFSSDEDTHALEWNVMNDTSHMYCIICMLSNNDPGQLLTACLSNK